MKTLPIVRPTGEQLPIISENNLGIEVIRGAAGSGKTSTAILRLRSLAYMFEQRRERQGRDDPVKVLVLTFNKTLKGYVSALVADQVQRLGNTQITIDTFGRWAMGHLGYRRIVTDSQRESRIRSLANSVDGIDPGYTIKEVDYLLGRFETENLEHYIETERTGRGTQPRVGKALRREILDRIVAPYQAWLVEHDLQDWNTLAQEMANSEQGLDYDIVIVDETQDFSANQLRAVRNHLGEEFSATFVIDTVQRIYARGFTWAETGIDMVGARYHSLRENHRNTAEIAEFAAGLLTGLVVEADGTLPDLTQARRSGELPTVLVGKFSRQMAWAIQYIGQQVDLDESSVAFLHPLGGGYFKEVRAQLHAAGLPFVEIARESEWPQGRENIALCTFHSAKGLEFDYVFILGLNAETTSHGDESVDDQIIVLRRLLAVAVARARRAVILGYKDDEKSDLTGYFLDGTYQEITL